MTQTQQPVVSPLATPPAETPGHGLLLGKKVVVTAAAGTRPPPSRCWPNTSLTPPCATPGPAAQRPRRP